MSTKGGSGGGGNDYPKGESSMTLSGLRCSGGSLLSINGPGQQRPIDSAIIYLAS